MGDLDTQFVLLKEMKGMGQNGALAKLPTKIQKKLGVGSTYVYTTKVSHDQCQATCANDHGTKWQVDKDMGMKNENYVSAVYVLNAKFEPVLGPVTKFGAEDMRVLAVGDELFVDYHYKGKIGRLDNSVWIMIIAKSLRWTLKL